MKNYQFKRTLLVLFASLYFLSISAQPAGINYQAIVRDNFGQILSNAHVSIRFTIHDVNPAGAVVFQETHAQTTNQLGLLNTVIGSGGSNLSAVNWPTGSKYLQVEVDVPGAGAYTDMGTSQLMSVPYALFAGKPAPLYTVKIDNVSITDPSIDHVATSSYGGFVTCMTSTGYYYNINRGVNTVESFNRGVGILFANDTTSGPLYAATPLYGCGSTQYYNYQGLITGACTNYSTGVYYIPLNAYPTAAPAWYLDSRCGHWYPNNYSSSSYGFYELVPNDNTVTGFNLYFPCIVSIAR
jgi:hypothetical protein